MDKFGVLTDNEATDKTASTTSAGTVPCPSCGKEVFRRGGVLICPVCGSEPFEQILRSSTKDDKEGD